MADSYEKQQAAWLKKTKLKIGDKVAVIATATSRQCGWDNVWIPERMEVPGEGVVDEIASAAQGIHVRTASGSWCYPFWVLIKLEDKE